MFAIEQNAPHCINYIDLPKLPLHMFFSLSIPAEDGLEMSNLEST